jgi:hypothetical protein
LHPSDLAEAANHFEGHAPDARAVVLPHVAHLTGMERRAELAPLVAGFLEPFRPWA